MQIFIGNVAEELEALGVTTDNILALLGTKLVESIALGTNGLTNDLLCKLLAN